jgi:pentatricopeptide repeat protein
MKALKVLLITFFLFGAMFSNVNAENTKTKSPYVQTEELNKYPVLSDVENKINADFLSLFVKGDVLSMDKMYAELNEGYQSASNDIFLYWMAYAEYYKAIYYSSVKRNEECKSSIDKALGTMEKMPAWNSEDLSLLALIQSFSLQFENQVKIPLILNSIKENFTKSMELDPKNIRAYYVAGSFDFYTPEQFGGGKQVESNLLKAIRGKEQNPENSYLPTWGKEDAYSMLISFYIKKERWEDAKDLFMEAKSKYPANYMLNSLATQLVGK